MIRNVLLLAPLLAACVKAPVGPEEKPPVDDTGPIGDHDDGDGFTVADGDCDDTDAQVYPGAPELCDDRDNDCDSEVDEDLAVSTWYRDADRDGFGGAADAVEGCEAPDGYVADGTDCNDRIAGIFPGAVEVCDGEDDDCDGVVDEDLTSTWYADADGDGYGDAAAPTEACEAPEAHVADATDCDDTDPARALECRPAAACERPSIETLEAADPGATSDLAFDQSCVAWVSSINSGADYVHGIDAAGAVTVLDGVDNLAIGALALDPATGTVVVSYNSAGLLGVQSYAELSVVATGGYALGSNWENDLLDDSASSLAMDAAGCIWYPNWTEAGTLDCLSLAGAATPVATLRGYVESVALDADDPGYVYASVYETVYRVDATTGAATALYTFDAVVLDMVFDYNGDLYVETTADELRLLEDGAAADTLYTAVSGDGKLAISPDGYLVRVQTNPVAPSTYQEWALGG